jgi:hypothetical protein
MPEIKCKSPILRVVWFCVRVCVRKGGIVFSKGIFMNKFYGVLVIASHCLLGTFLMSAEGAFAEKAYVEQAKHQKVGETEKPWDYWGLSLPWLGVEKSFYLGEKTTAVFGLANLMPSRVTGDSGLAALFAFGCKLSLGYNLGTKTRLRFGAHFIPFLTEDFWRGIGPFFAWDILLNEKWIFNLGCIFHMMPGYANKSNSFLAPTPIIGFKYRF